VLLAAGDIASCSSSGDEATANLLDRLDGQVVSLGDHAYERGTTPEFANCYGPSWGRHKGRTHPARGNHDTYTAGGAPYTSYFGGVARWYSWDHAGWHVIALDSNAPSDAGQLQWLRDDLAAHAGTRCTLAYWHHPRWSSGTHGSSAAVTPLWDTVAAGGVDVVLAAHDHDYERFAPVDGIRSWVVGTGGRSHYRFTKAPLPQTDVRDDTSFGVLELTLHDAGYDWRFVAATGAFADGGSGACR
jgi:3',5'-cyclic AMP phosphodiesterase CpdA